MQQCKISYEAHLPWNQNPIQVQVDVLSNYLLVKLLLDVAACLYWYTLSMDKQKCNK